MSPTGLLAEEADLLRQADSLARTGRAADGLVLPLYFHVRDNVWAQPLPVYSSAFALAPVGVSGDTIRWPSLLLAGVNVALFFAIARRVFRRAALAAIAACLLAATPAHVVYGRLAVGSVYALACTLAWLLGIVGFAHSGRRWMLFAATLCLGIGFYSHPTAVLMMPVFVVLTILLVYWVDGPPSLYGVAIAGFALPMLPLVPWFARYHDTFRFTLGDWGLHTLANPRDGLKYTVLNWSKIATRSSLYWEYFRPSSLFLITEEHATASGPAGVFLAVIAIPMAYGVWRIAVSLWLQPIWRLAVVAFVLSPLAAAAFDAGDEIGRALYIVPFGILIAAAGLQALLADRRRVARAVAVAVLCAAPLEFLRFYVYDVMRQRPAAVARTSVVTPAPK